MPLTRQKKRRTRFPLPKALLHLAHAQVDALKSNDWMWKPPKASNYPKQMKL